MGHTLFIGLLSFEENLAANAGISSPAVVVLFLAGIFAINLFNKVSALFGSVGNPKPLLGLCAVVLTVKSACVEHEPVFVELAETDRVRAAEIVYILHHVGAIFRTVGNPQLLAVVFTVGSGENNFVVEAGQILHI